MDCRDLLIQWLNNAYAMENALLEIMQRDAEVTGTMDSSGLGHHIDETRNQAERAKMEIKRLGGEIVDPDHDKKLLFETLIQISKESSPVQEIKNAIMSYAAEQMEVAEYIAIIRLALACNEPLTAKAMKETLHEENAMAKKTKAALQKILDRFVDSLG